MASLGDLLSSHLDLECRPEKWGTDARDPAQSGLDVKQGRGEPPLFLVAVGPPIHFGGTLSHLHQGKLHARSLETARLLSPAQDLKPEYIHLGHSERKSDLGQCPPRPCREID